MPNAVKQHLLFASWCTGFKSLRFDSQSKERVTNSVAEVTEFFKDIDFDKIAKQILNCPAILDPMISAILYKKELAEKLALQKKQKSVTKLRVINHIAATDSNPENRILFLAEGLSAIGPLIAVRDPKKHAGYPLRGKVMNVRGMKHIDIMGNKEITELLSIIGLELGKPAKNLNYGKIAIMTDSDVDGASIFCLLLNLFSNWPELYKEGRIVRLMTLLYSCVKGKTVQTFFDKTSFDKFNSKGYEVSYNKGLGTLTKEVYKACLHDPYFVEVLPSNDNFKKLQMAFGDSSEPRKEWMLSL
jgi:DNA gyrase/topoisomerase IV subunit B